MILGFGSTETELEQEECERVDAFIRDQFNNHEPLRIFTGSVVTALKNMLRAREEELKALDKKYHTAVDYPDRYSTYHSTVLTNGADLVVVFKFFHINRRHGLSPDGWAALQTVKLHYISAQDVEK